MKNVDKDLFMADNCRQTKDYAEAIYYYTKVIEKSPSVPDHYWLRSLCKKELGDYKGSIADCDLALKINPDWHFVHSQKGDLNDLLKNYDEAIKNYSDAIKIEPIIRCYFFSRGMIKEKIGDLKGALIDYQLSRSSSVCEDEGVLLFSARVLLKLREFHAALNKLNDLILFKEDIPEAYYYRGLVYQNLLRYKESIKDFSSVLKLMPDSGYVYYLRGMSFMSLKQFSDAIEDFDKAMYLSPENKSSQLQKGLAMICLGEMGIGISILENVLSDEPLNTSAISYLGVARILSGDNIRGMNDIWASNDIRKKQGLENPPGSIHKKRKKSPSSDDYLHIVEI